MFAAGYDRGAGKAREHCDVVVGADLVYSADVVEKLCKTIVALGCSRVYYCAPSTGRAGSQEFLERLEKLGFDRHTIDAPAFSEAPCDEAALYFPDLAQSKFKLHTFVRQEPASPSYQAMVLSHTGGFEERQIGAGRSRETRFIAKGAAQTHHDAEGRQAREGGHPGRPFEPLPPRRYPHNPQEDDTPASIKRRERVMLDDAVRKTGLPVAGEPVPACSGPGAFMGSANPKRNHGPRQQQRYKTPARAPDSPDSVDCPGRLSHRRCWALFTSESARLRTPSTTWMSIDLSTAVWQSFR